jgi:hypothetical protein
MFTGADGVRLGDGVEGAIEADDDVGDGDGSTDGAVAVGDGDGFTTCCAPHAVTHTRRAAKTRTCTD